MRKFLNYFLSFFALASLLFLASCGDDGELPIPGDDSITLSTDDGSIEDDTLKAAPGDTVYITASLGIGSDGEITVVTDNGTVVSVPSPNTISSGDEIALTIVSSAQPGDEATVTFSSGSINEQLVIVVAYETVGQIIAATSDLSTLNQAVTAAGLETALNDANAQYTIFAPRNAAFSDVDLAGYTEEELASILGYHVIEDQILTGDALVTGKYLTMNGDSVDIEVNGDDITVNGIAVSTPNLTADNGVVHIVDEIIMPDVTTYEAFLLAAPTGEMTSETFFSTSTGELYSYDEVVTTTENLSQTIDFGYAYGVTETATLNAPSAYPDYIGYDMSRWGTLNATTFRNTNLSAEAFDAISVGQGDDIEAEYEAGTAPTNPNRVTGLAEGNVVAFQTVDNRFGLIKVVEVVGTTGSNDGIRIEVKVTN